MGCVMQDKLFRKAALEKLSSPEELDQLMQVTTPKGWLALVALICVLVATVVIGIFSVIPVRVEGQYCILVNDPAAEYTQAIIYIPPAKDNAIQVGDEAQITPSTVRKADSGFIVGRTVSVGEFPVSASEMQAVLGNETLVNQLLQDGPLVQMVVELLPAEVTADNPTGYQWSSGNIPSIEIRSKLPCLASIQIDEKAPIDLILRDFNA
jgi:hypothetical protein